MTILILKVGETLPAVRAHRGDFEHWFASGLGVDCQVHDARSDGVPVDPHHHAGVVITGSGAMVSAREPWSEALVPWLREAVAGIPVLGVCYGHQLVAHALGGVVGRNPAGRQIGTQAVTLDATGPDPLLSDLPPRIEVQVSHQESVLTPPPNTVVLGCTAGDPHHVLRFGEQAWGVQFHPEFDADIVRGYLQGRRDAIQAEGLGVDALIDQVHDTPWGPRLLRRFAAICRT